LLIQPPQGRSSRRPQPRAAAAGRRRPPTTSPTQPVVVVASEPTTATQPSQPTPATRDAEPSAKRRRKEPPTPPTSTLRNVTREAPVLIAIPTARNLSDTAQSTPRPETSTEILAITSLQTNNSTTLTDDEENEQGSFSNWVAITPEQIVQSAYSASRPRSRRNTTNADPSPRLANRAKRKTKSRAVVTYAESDGDDNSDASEENEERPRDSSDTSHTDQARNPSMSNRTTRKQRKPRARADTPEGAELVTIVPSIVTMYELASRDRRTGHKSEREKKMRQVDWTAVKQRRKEEEVQMAMKGRKINPKDARAAAEEDDSDQNLDQEAQLKKLFAKTAKDKKTKSGIQIRLVNGQQVIDEQSQRVDFHALANQDLAGAEEVEDDDITKRFNAQTYINMKRREPAERIPNREKWGDETTEKFYDCLSRYGTDFMIISNMFPGKSRRQIRAKFVKEERENPTKIKEALLGLSRRNWDMEHFKQETGLQDTDFKDPREIEEELRKQRERREVEIEAARLAAAEDKRQRRLIGAYSSDEDEQETIQLAKPPNRITEVIEIMDDDEEDED